VAKVDLPMPGGPANRVKLPGTMPPPRTRLTSLISVDMRTIWEALTLSAGIGLSDEAVVVELIWVDGILISLIEFQAWQLGHWPYHLDKVLPQLSQIKVDVDLDMSTLYKLKVQSSKLKVEEIR